MDKVCCLCYHFWFYGGSPGYSEYTPPDMPEVECMKDHWKMSLHDGIEEYRKNILTANKCDDYIYYKKQSTK